MRRFVFVTGKYNKNFKKFYCKMKKHQILFTAVYIFLTCTSILSDNWILFKKKENVEGQICMNSDSVFNKIQIFDKSACLLDCVHHSDCKSVFYGQYTGDCIGCISSYDISNQPTGVGDSLEYYMYWQPGCSDGWSSFVNSCYLITQTKMTFQAGLAACQSLNARAVIIDNEEENNYLKTLINSTIKYTDEEYAFFTGFTDINNEGTWVEHGSSNQIRFQDWANGEPNSGTNENCLGFYYPFDLRWVDVPCSWELRMICEMDE